MFLILEHPEVAFRSCEDCQKHVYDMKTGVRQEVQGKPAVRPPGTKPPCGYSEKACPKVSPTAGKELTPENTQAWVHYQECRAVGQFPDDEIVRRNARIIRAIEDNHDRMFQTKQLLMVFQAGITRR